MSETRSNGGCWTCRVRRKKCDEAHPACLICTSLNIPCYGYGPKPTWMDRGVKEREVAKSLRSLVKQTISLQRARQSRRSDSMNEAIIHDSAPFDSFENSSSFGVSTGGESVAAGSLLPGGHSPVETSDTLPPFDTSSNPESFHPENYHDSLSEPVRQSSASTITAGSPSNEGVDLILTSENWSVLPVHFEEDQASLLMHFFDHVLPLQFRFYNPSIVEGGRGWMLSILTRTKPLYHVALSLAAYHQQSVLVREKQFSCTASLRKLEERHIECLKALRHHLQDSPVALLQNTCEAKIEIMACIAMLIALELFRGDTNHWQMHLKAVSSLPVKFGVGHINVYPLSRTHELAMSFFRGVIDWYDILSCASTGLKPMSKFDAVEENPPIRFEKLMGCESWLMGLIKEIVILSEWKRNLEENGGLSMWELVRRAADIQTRLETGLIESSRQASIKMSYHSTTRSASSEISRSLIHDVTRVFAGGAFVFLQVVIAGPYPDIPEVRQGVSRTMEALDALGDQELVRNLLWPVCIAGSMASEEHEPYWRNLLSNASKVKWSFGNPSNVLKIVEECWRLRKLRTELAEPIDWMTAMKVLDMKVLLV